MSKVLITGGAGFIGSHIAEELLAQGHDVLIVDNLSSGRQENIPAKAKFSKIDIRSPDMRVWLKQEKPDLIVHAAAQMSVRVSMEDPCLDTDINVAGLVNILSCLRDPNSQPYVVFLSTGGAIYGEQEAFPATERHATRPESVYGLAKRVSEMYLDFWQRIYGLKFCALRLANVYGPRQNPHGEAGVVAIFCQRLGRKQTCTINGSGGQTRDFVFVKDVARAVGLVCQHKVSGIYNIGTGIETSINDIFEKLRAILAPEVQAEHGPVKPGEQQRSVISPALAKKTFNWKPEVTLTDGLAETAKGY
jgi:UDP-glucose 4-epimerase